MKNYLRLLAAAFALVMILSFFACDGKDKNETTEAEQTTSAVTNPDIETTLGETVTSEVETVAPETSDNGSESEILTETETDSDTDIDTDTETETDTNSETETTETAFVETESETVEETTTEAHACDFGEWVTVTEATCTETGLQERICECGMKETQTIEMLDHTEGEVVVENNTDPDCVNNGSYDNVVYCTVCNTELSRDNVTVDALGHTEAVDAKVDATCTETGLTEGKHCSVCNEVLVKQEIVDALGHTEAVDAKVDATCTETGLTEGKHCSVCNEVLVKQEVIDALGHTEVIVPGKAASCTEGGITDGKTCSVCGDTLVAQKEIPVHGFPISSLEELMAAAATQGSYYLTTDIVITENIQITENINICLNGKKLSREGEEAFIMLTVAESATLTLTDCGTEERAGYIDPTTGLWTEGVYSGEESVIEYALYGGVITNGAGVGGRAIYVYGTLNTYGINFAGNVGDSKGGALYAAGVYNDEGSTFVGNATSNQSGALEVAGGATLINTVFAYNRSTANRAGALLVTGNGINAYGVTFMGNVAYNGHGGAVIVTGAKTESVFDNCIFEGNLAVEGEDARAGAIYAHNSEPVITLSCQFIGNSADLGGAVYNTSSADYIDGKAGSSEFGSIFKDNTSIAAGGAIYAAGQVNLYGSKFVNNVATTSGGAIYAYNNTNAINCTFTGNSATNDGGAVYVVAGKTYIDGEAVENEGVITNVVNGSTYTSNTAANGGAICVEVTKSTQTAGTIKLYGSTFTSNSASTYGGAVAVIGSAAEIYYCSFDSNTADKAGGAVAITSYDYKVDSVSYRITSTLTMVGGEVKNNTVETTWSSSGSYGGGIIVYYGSQATIDGVVFDNNKAYSGGAITSYGSAKVKNGEEVTTVYTNVILNNVTVKNNDGQNGAIYVGGAGRMTVNDLIATDNTTKGSGAVFYLTSASSVLTINSATISGNKAKADHNDPTTGNLGFVATANSANTLNIYKAGVTGADVNDNWDALITKGGASTVNELTEPTM